jgi:hypothetical protein
VRGGRVLDLYPLRANKDDRQGFLKYKFTIRACDHTTQTFDGIIVTPLQRPSIFINYNTPAFFEAIPAVNYSSVFRYQINSDIPVTQMRKRQLQRRENKENFHLPVRGGHNLFHHIKPFFIKE